MPARPFSDLKRLLKLTSLGLLLLLTVDEERGKVAAAALSGA